MRAKAALQIKERFEDLSVTLAIPKLYGISAFGRDIAYFSYDPKTLQLTPPIAPNTSGHIEDVAPKVRLDTNVMEDNGRARFLQIVREIKDMSDPSGRFPCVFDPVAYWM